MRTFKNRNLPFVNGAGFTLIELLVVISIIGVLAALTIPVLGALKRQQDLRVARAEMESIETALDGYKAKYGVYPPGNSADSKLNSLFYELCGVSSNDKGANFQSLDGSTGIPSGALSVFGVKGIINCSQGSPEDGVQAENFMPALKLNRIGVYTNTSYPLKPLNILVTSVGGPDQNYQPLGGENLNPFRYLYPGTNNPNSYDLWVQLVIKGKTNLICNWSKQVIINSPLP